MVIHQQQQQSTGAPIVPDNPKTMPPVETVVGKPVVKISSAGVGEGVTKGRFKVFPGPSIIPPAAPDGPAATTVVVPPQSSLPQPSPAASGTQPVVTTMTTTGGSSVRQETQSTSTVAQTPAPQVTVAKSVVAAAAPAAVPNDTATTQQQQHTEQQQPSTGWLVSESGVVSNIKPIQSTTPPLAPAPAPTVSLPEDRQAGVVVVQQPKPSAAVPPSVPTLVTPQITTATTVPKVKPPPSSEEQKPVVIGRFKITPAPVQPPAEPALHQPPPPPPPQQPTPPPPQQPTTGKDRSFSVMTVVAPPTQSVPVAVQPPAPPTVLVSNMPVASEITAANGMLPGTTTTTTTTTTVVSTTVATPVGPQSQQQLPQQQQQQQPLTVSSTVPLSVPPSVSPSSTVSAPGTASSSYQSGSVPVSISKHTRAVSSPTFDNGTTTVIGVAATAQHPHQQPIQPEAVTAASLSRSSSSDTFTGSYDNVSRPPLPKPNAKTAKAPGSVRTSVKTTPPSSDSRGTSSSTSSSLSGSDKLFYHLDQIRQEALDKENKLKLFQSENKALVSTASQVEVTSRFVDREDECDCLQA